MNDLTIGQVAKTAGVNVETIRFYERKGLIRQPPREGSGFRKYAPSVVARVRFIRRAKDLGFSLREISDLLDLHVDPSVRCNDVKAAAEAKIEDIEAKVQALLQMREALTELVGACDRREDTDDCPILLALGEERQVSGA
jgi:MerR family mercuric resistance operon transcriptional regulator